jgi:hypothetical protein
MRTYLHNLRSHGHHLDIVVCSDPHGAGMDRTYRELLAHLQAEYGQPMWYAGPREKERYIAEISQDGDIPPEVVRFALFDIENTGKAYGVNRNALRLHLADELFLSADDDTLAEMYHSLDQENGVNFCTDAGVSEIRVVADRAAAKRLVRSIEVDLVGMHSGILGVSTAEVVTRHSANQPPSFTRADFSSLPDLEYGRGQIVASYHGWLGDSAWASPKDAQFLDGASWQWLTRSQEAYQQALQSWQQVRYVNHLTLSRSSEFYTIASGFDGRRPLPPFIPVQRREDVLFGLMLACCTNDAYVAHLSTMITHGRVDREPASDQDARETIDFATLVEICILSFPTPIGPVDDVTRWRRLGRHLEEIGSFAPADFAHWMRRELRGHSESLLQQLEQRAATCPPDRAFWARDLRQVITISRRSLERNDCFLPRGLASGRSPADTQALAQRLLTAYGQLVRYWPDLLEKTRALRRRGIRLARPLTVVDSRE